MALLVWHFKGTKQSESYLCPLAPFIGLPLGNLFLVDLLFQSLKNKCALSLE